MITVIFSSRNGGDVLPAMLESLSRAAAPRGGWALIAVDNGSEDNTADILRSYSSRLPLTVLRESKPGKSRGLNHALTCARGDLHVFCDSDVLVPEDWLEAWRSTADDHPDYDLFAGSALPLWPSHVPEWIEREVNLPVVFAVHEGLADGPCGADRMHGNNMAIRASAFRTGARFDPTIGPDGTSTYAMGCETDLALRLQAAGARCWFSNKPSVQHVIRREQLSPEWILQRAYRFGRGEGRMNRAHSMHPFALAAKNAVKSVFYPAFLNSCEQPARWRRCWQWAFDMGYQDATREKHGHEPRWGNRVATLVAKRAVASLSEAQASRPAPSASG